jgi:thiol:disulfide interchange protein
VSVGVLLLLLLLFGGFGGFGGVMVYLLVQRRAAIDESRAPALPARPTTPTIIELSPDQALAEQLQSHAGRAKANGRRPLLEFGASWCPPSKLFGDALPDRRMQEALAGIYLIRANIDAFGHDPLLRELETGSVPVFFELDGEGRATGRSLTGGAWGADTIENMSAAIEQFCAGARGGQR